MACSATVGRRKRKGSQPLQLKQKENAKEKHIGTHTHDCDDSLLGSERAASMTNL